MTYDTVPWMHPHRQVVRIESSEPLWLCLECGLMYQPNASDDGGDPREWFIPAVSLAAQATPPAQAKLPDFRTAIERRGVCTCAVTQVQPDGTSSVIRKGTCGTCVLAAASLGRRS